MTQRLIVATGHRPDKLGGTEAMRRRELEAFALREVCLATDAEGEPHFLIGMAMGWDLAVAWACQEVNVPFTAAVPFEGQDSLWPYTQRTMRFGLLACAAHIVVVTQEQPKSPLQVREAMLRRNRWMVDQLVGEKDSVLALWNGSQGGTAHCVNYAHERKKTVRNAWSDWEKFLKEQSE